MKNFTPVTRELISLVVKKTLFLSGLILGLSASAWSQAAAITPVTVKICTATNISFTVTAAGSNITYQWQESIDGGTTWNNLAENTTSGTNPAYGIYTGTTTPTLKITKAPSYLYGRKYRALVSVNGGSAVPSNTGTLSVVPSANLDPGTTTNCPTSPNTINNGGTSGETYTWQVSSNSGASWTNVVAGTDPTGVVYTINSTGLLISSLNNAIDGYQYRYIADDNAGCVITSAATTQKVPVLPSFTLPAPGSITANLGDAVNIPVTITGGTAPFAYQWQSSTGTSWANIATTNTSYTGATTSILGIPSMTATMYGNKYRVIVRNNPGNCAAGSASFVTIGLPVTLPLNITSFSAEKQSGTAVKLSWAVDGSNIPQFFAVERSTDNASFTGVGSVKAETGKTTYSFIDAGVNSPDVQYRLKAAGQGGASAYSSIVKIHDEGDSRRIELRPTSTTSGLTSLYTALNKNETIQLTVTDIMGRVQWTQVLRLGRGENYTSLNVSRLSKGIYYLRASSLDGSSKVLPLVIN